MVNVERLIIEFQNLLNIESPSRKEGKLAYYIASVFEALGYKVFFDKCGEIAESEVGNLIVKIPGTVPADPIFFSAHMDTVGPYENPKIIFENGIFRSDGRTILGADDKSGIAVLIEVGKILKEEPFPHPPVEFIFTVCEEIGLKGAKCLDTELIDSKEGFVLDAEAPDVVINRSPSAYEYEIKIKGKAAHAGIEPEKGLSAIKIGADLVRELPQGRIDGETTANIGLIQGGKYINIVPESCEIKGEMRSHNEDKLTALKELIKEKVEEVKKRHFREDLGLPEINTYFSTSFKGFYIKEDDPLCELVKRAGNRIGLEIKFAKKEGGSDANAFNEKGIKALLLGTGMQKVHTTEEYIRISDMIIISNLVLEIIKIKGESA